MAVYHGIRALLVQDGPIQENAAGSFRIVIRQGPTLTRVTVHVNEEHHHEEIRWEVQGHLPRNL